MTVFRYLRFKETPISEGRNENLIFSINLGKFGLSSRCDDLKNKAQQY